MPARFLSLQRPLRRGLALLLVLAAAASLVTAQSEAEPASDSYIIGVGDLLKVSVWKNPDLLAEVPVRPDGRISVALIGEVHALWNALDL